MRNAPLPSPDGRRRDNLVYLQDRSADMLKKDLIVKNPLRALEPGTEQNTAPEPVGKVHATPESQVI